MKGKLSTLKLPAEIAHVTELAAGVLKWHRATCKVEGCKVWTEAVGRREDRKLVFRHGLDRILPIPPKPTRHIVVIGNSGHSYTLRHLPKCPQPHHQCPVAAAVRTSLDIKARRYEPGEYECWADDEGVLQPGVPYAAEPADSVVAP